MQTSQGSNGRRPLPGSLTHLVVGPNPAAPRGQLSATGCVRTSGVCQDSLPAGGGGLESSSPASLASSSRRGGHQPLPFPSVPSQICPFPASPEVCRAQGRQSLCCDLVRVSPEHPCPRGGPGLGAEPLLGRHRLPFDLWESHLEEALWRVGAPGPPFP